MAKDYGPSVSRVLPTAQSQYTSVIWGLDKPPLDSELNMVADISEEMLRSVVSREVPSGWIDSSLTDAPYFTNPSWSNWFQFGQDKSIQWAAVNGWLVPVTGTRTGTPPGSPDDASTWNRIALDPPPSNSGDSRVDFVFLEVWKALLAPDPGTDNKPSTSSIYRYGNVEGGMSYLSDDMKDPDLGIETSKRVQVQYRIRVVKGLVGLQSFPDGFDPANVKARGANTTDTSYVFTNMKDELGDPGLWRAGNGSPNALGTVDGYSYAIPLAVVFRRNSVAWDGDPGQNLNGGFNRNPTSIDRTGWKTFSTVPTTSATMTAVQTSLTLTASTNLPLPASPSTPVYIQVGDEIMTYTSITGSTVTLGSRGQLGTKAESHPAGTVVRVVSGRPDGLFSDQIAKTDIYDLRHVVNSNGVDYDAVLKGNFDKLIRGQLRANWKRSGGTQGTYVLLQDKISASPAALGVSKLDAPDGLRMVWSDASIAQPFEFIAALPSGTTASEDIDTAWGFPYSGNTCDNTGGAGGSFKNAAVLTLPIAQFKNTLPGADTDQVSYPTVANSVANPWVKIRLAGTSTYLTPGVDFSVAVPSNSSSNLVITLTTGSAITVPLFITFHVLYGAGRGLSHRPNSVHSVAYLNSSSGTYLRQKGATNNDIPVSVAWAPLWSKLRSSDLSGNPPITAESYVDPGSKTVILTPFRQVSLPSTYTAEQGGTMMPDSGDPLGMFSTSSDPNLSRQNTFLVIPRNLIPGWGDVHAPIVHTDNGTITQGINFGFDAPKGNFSAGTDPRNNVVAYANTADSKSFATFTTVDLTTAGSTNTPATYNALTPSVVSATPCGMRFFTDTTGRGRTGLELPKYYGPARLWAVYEAEDFATNGSAFDAATRASLGTGATNLLRQNLDGPTMWITLDSNGDSTFVLNSEAIDLAKSPNAIASFEAGHYVLEMSTFGFDRGFFDLSQEARLVLPRLRNDDIDLNTASVNLAIPAPPLGSDSIAVNYSRTPYMGDAFGSQLNQTDTLHLRGPLTSTVAYQLGTLELDQENLSRPNQKVMGVLASLSFATTLGTGRLAGDYDSTLPAVNLRSPGYQDASAYPPASAVAARPTLKVGGALSAADDLLPLGTEVLGCIEHLPLGGLYRSHDFRGEVLEASQGWRSTPLNIMPSAPGLEATTLGFSSTLEQHEVPVNTSSQGGGTPGEILVHVDGETSNYSDVDNYRTTRGGSAFVASGDRPGGELSGALGSLSAGTNYNAVLAGKAYLVVLAPLSLGATQVSAGSELAMLVVTTATRKHESKALPVRVLCGTNGSGEAFSAADLYRISGHPLVNFKGPAVNPSEVPLTAKTSLKPRMGA